MGNVDWRSDTSLAYAIFRLTVGVNICFRGVMRVFVIGLDTFGAGMTKQFAATFFPAFFINTFAHTLPWIEIAVGVLLILGLKTRVALVIGGLMMTALTFGTMFLGDFNLAWLQLTYALVFFVLLATRSWNVISLDAVLGGERGGQRTLAV
jgi:thiosulfate dehydrogenase [quinone] large subunit